MLSKKRDETPGRSPFNNTQTLEGCSDLRVMSEQKRQSAVESTLDQKQYNQDFVQEFGVISKEMSVDDPAKAAK